MTTNLPHTLARPCGGAAPRAVLLCLCLVTGVAPATARELLVGPGRALERPSDAARVARDGDRVLIDAGVYRGDAAVWRADGLRIRAVGGEVVLVADGAHAQGKGIWITAGRDIEIEGIAFVGARVPHGNGAGIRHQGIGLTLRRCRFENNQTGLLTHNNPRDRILVEQSVFAHNGAGRGQTHNLYVGRAARLEVRATALHHARVGHNLKSRAAETVLAYNRIMDEADGNASYAVDLPEGGDALLLGNLIQQGPRTENWALVSYGAEGRRAMRHRLRMIHNTLVNDAADGVFVHVHPGKTELTLVNNLLVGPGRAFLGVPEDTARDLHLVDDPFVDRGRFDYRPVLDPRVVDAAVALPAGAPRPEREFQADGAPAVPRPIRGAGLDIGALVHRPL